MGVEPESSRITVLFTMSTWQSSSLNGLFICGITFHILGHENNLTTIILCNWLMSSKRFTVIYKTVLPNERRPIWRQKGLLLSHRVDVGVKLAELRRGNLIQKAGELVLPFLAMSEYCKLEWRTVEKHKLNVGNRLDHLNVVRHLRVSVGNISSQQISNDIIIVPSVIRNSQ